MLSVHTTMLGCTQLQRGTQLVCKPACRRARSRQHRTSALLRQFANAAIAEPLIVPFEKDAEHLSAWTPDSWKQRTAHQQPNYTDEKRLTDAVDIIARMPPLVFAGECRNLQIRLAKCATGEAFLVQGKNYPKRRSCTARSA